MNTRYVTCPECDANFKARDIKHLPIHRAFKGDGICPGSSLVFLAKGESEPVEPKS